MDGRQPDASPSSEQAARPLSKSVGDDGCAFDGPAISDAERAKVEAAITALVEDFYGKARQDDLLGPVFAAAVADWDGHLKTVADFWSHALLKTQRYTGFPFPVHTQLPTLKPEHFPRWLALFEESAAEILPGDYAGQAIARARHMARSFVAGVFPFTDKHGRPARKPG
ncbi:group III truncated hemoglobin [Methylocella sp.]|uniref:group III truncated hemoglobin n=1 Tax=Methylocella sp. TaxID=1978226 RepID=UPI0037846703